MTVQLSTLENGLRVATDTMQETESAVIGAWVGVGTRHEPWKTNGVAHLVEHMMFKGTKKRSAYGLSTAIEKNGGSMNAHTTREETAYYARVLPEDAALACEIIADMLQNSRFAQKELGRERKVIIQEIGRDHDTPEDYIFDLAQSLAFPHQRLGRPILGSVEVIGQLPRSEVLNYVGKHYHAGNVVVVGAGRITHTQLVDLARKHFGKLKHHKPEQTEKAHFNSGERRETRDIEQLHLIFGFPSPGFKNNAIYPIQLLGILLGGVSSSRLFQKVREKRGLVYHISAGPIAYSDTGIFQIYAGTDPVRAKELIPVVREELKNVSKHVTAGELARAKAQVRADLLMGRENVMRRADVLGHQMVAFGKPIPTEKILEQFEAVTCKGVENAATKIFTRKPIFTALGPTKAG